MFSLIKKPTGSRKVSQISIQANRNRIANVMCNATLTVMTKVLCHHKMQVMKFTGLVSCIFPVNLPKLLGNKEVLIDNVIEN